MHIIFTYLPGVSM